MPDPSIYDPSSSQSKEIKEELKKAVEKLRAVSRGTDPPGSGPLFARYTPYSAPRATVGAKYSAAACTPLSPWKARSVPVIDWFDGESTSEPVIISPGLSLVEFVHPPSLQGFFKGCTQSTITFANVLGFPVSAKERKEHHLHRNSYYLIHDLLFGPDGGPPVARVTGAPDDRLLIRIRGASNWPALCSALPITKKMLQKAGAKSTFGQFLDKGGLPHPLRSLPRTNP